MLLTSYEIYHLCKIRFLFKIARAEKDEILVFEGHLAAATNGFVITESTSRLISQLISLDPTGPPRQPPSNVMKQLKGLNEKFKLGKLLCQSRKPDFLLSIIESQVCDQRKDLVRLFSAFFIFKCCVNVVGKIWCFFSIQILNVFL